MQRNKLRIVLLLLMWSVLLHACSIKTAYRQLDWLLAEIIDDYASLSEAQEADTEQRIKSFLQWHQFTQLEIYTQDLQQTKNYILLGLDDTRVEDIFDRIGRGWNAIRNHAAPEMADMFLSLDGQQQQKLFANLAKKNQEMKEEFNEYTSQERERRSSDKLIENVEDWLGDLNKQQKDILRSWQKKFKPLHEDRMVFRRKWQDALKLILEKPLPAAEKRSELIALVNQPQLYQTQEHQQKLAYNAEQFKALILQIEATLTPQQRTFLMERLDYLIVNFKELAAEQLSK